MVCLHVHRRAVQVFPEHRRPLLAYLVAREAYAEAIAEIALLAAASPDRDELVSLWEELIAAALTDPISVAARGVPFPQLLRLAADQLPELEPRYARDLATWHAALGHAEIAEDILHTTVHTTASEDVFRMTFTAYLAFRESKVAAAFAEFTSEQQREFDVDSPFVLGEPRCFTAARRAERQLRALRTDRHELAAAVALRRNPRDVQAWHTAASAARRARGVQGMVETFRRGIRAVTAPITPGEAPPSRLPLAASLAVSTLRCLAGAGLLADARREYRRLISSPWPNTEDLPHLVRGYIELEVKYAAAPDGDLSAALATLESSVAPGGSCHNDPSAWALLFDLLAATPGRGVSAVQAAFADAVAARAVAPHSVCALAGALMAAGDVESAFRSYELALHTFPFPARATLWAAYLRHAATGLPRSPHRVRETFEDAIADLPPGQPSLLLAVLLQYARWEADIGCHRHATCLLTRALKALPPSHKSLPAVAAVAMSNAVRAGGLPALTDFASLFIDPEDVSYPPEVVAAVATRLADVQLGCGDEDAARDTLSAIARRFSSSGSSTAHDASQKVWAAWRALEEQSADDTAYLAFVAAARAAGIAVADNDNHSQPNGATSTS
jgi:hypothetical protein